MFKKNKPTNIDKFYDIITSEKYKDQFMYDVIPLQLSIDILSEYLIGEKEYANTKWPQENLNTLIVYNILTKYSRKFNKDLKKRQKHALHKTKRRGSKNV